MSNINNNIRAEIDRRKFIKQGVFSVLGATSVSRHALAGTQSHRLLTENAVRGAKERPNILWIVAEDLCPDLSCYGTPLVKTPNIDKLAADGTMFTNAFSTAPVCSASRSAILTGMYQTTISAHHHRSPQLPALPDDVKFATEFFRQAGYYTCNNHALDWDKRGKIDCNFQIPEHPFDGTDWRDRKPRQPFFAQVHFGETHRGFARDRRNPIDPDLVRLPPYYPDHPLARRDWANYLEYIQILDRKVGKVLERLRNDHLEKNTIVFFFSDHGRPHVRGKQYLYDGGIHIPLVVRWPGHIKPGTVDNDLISGIDLLPTTLRMAGTGVPDYMQGRSFWGRNVEERDFIVSARDRIDETYDHVRCIRTRKLKYLRNFRPNQPYIQINVVPRLVLPVLTLMEVLYEQGKLTPAQTKFMAEARPFEELYDLEKDPHEINNLACDPSYRRQLKQMRGILQEWIVETDDHGRNREDPAIAENVRKKFMKRFYEPRMKRRGLDPNITPQQYLKYWEDKMLSDK